MRILFVNGHLHVGGVEKSLINVLKSIDYSQHQVDLLLVEDLGEYTDDIPTQVQLFYYDLKPTYGAVRKVLSSAIARKDLKLVRRKIAITAANKTTRKFLRLMDLPKEIRKEYDCAIAYRVGMPLDLVSFVIKAHVKCVWWHHGEFDYSGKQVRNWTQAFGQVNHIICVSESSKRMIEPHFPKLKDKMCVMPNMLIPEDLKREAEKFNPYKNESKKTILVSVGRMSPEKHFEDTVGAMNELKKRGFYDIVWYLVGDGTERHVIEERVSEYGLNDNFCLVGNQKNPYPYIKNADVFVHPSRVESQGIIVLEAMSLGKPCVVVHSAGTDEFVVDGYNAIQADQTVQALADRIEYILYHLNDIDLHIGQRETMKSFLPAVNMSKLYSLMNRG